MLKKFALLSLVSVFLFAFSISANAEDRVRVSVGAGAILFEGDEEVRHGGMYGVRGNYQLDPHWSIDGLVAIMPHLEAREYDDARFALDEDVFGVKVLIEGLYHAAGYVDKGFDPYLSAGVGLNIYDKSLGDGSMDEFPAIGLGTFYHFDSKWFARADYRFSMTDPFEDTEWNNDFLVSVGYSWGGDSMGGDSDAGGLGTDASIAELKQVYFAFDSSALSDSAKATLDHNAGWLTENSDVDVTVEGHCDERGTVEYNLALGERRAQSAFDYMRAKGIDSGRMSTISYGEEFPANPGKTEEAYAENRRAEFKPKY